MDLVDIFRAFHPEIAKHTFFSIVHLTFSRIYNILGHKTSNNKFKKTENISKFFCDYNGVKLEINNEGGEKREKLTKTCKLNNMLLNN